MSDHAEGGSQDGNKARDAQPKGPPSMIPGETDHRCVISPPQAQGADRGAGKHAQEALQLRNVQACKNGVTDDIERVTEKIGGPDGCSSHIFGPVMTI